MAAQTHDSSGSNHEGASGSARTPVSSYIGVAIIAALVLAMILLQAFGSAELAIAD
jgi:hypothetical protein